jgi:cytochrome c oxidase subunit 1
VALFLLTFDRMFDANFFDVSQGADPLLWEHLFWIFGHPEVYILILPAFGIVSEIIPVFARKPIFGYPFMVFSGIAIGFMGWGVWAHHMFSSGMGPLSVAAFAMSTMFIAVPTGVKILNWLATMWGGKLSFTTPMLFAVGLVTMFTIGGLSGVTHAVAPSDTQQTDTYYIVAHFHYVIFGGALFGFLGGMYFWWPKVFGHRLGEALGKWHFWTILIGFNLTFGPMHILGLQGMPRRMHTYVDGYGFNFWNMASTIGAFVIGVSMLIFFANILLSWRRHKADPEPVGPDPWDARSLEWMVPSPVPAHNFDAPPTVSHLDEFWHRKYQEDEHGKVRRVATGAEVAQRGDASDVHLPSPSYWPLVMALGLPLIGYGVIFNLGLAALGALIVVIGGFGWGYEPADDPEARHHGPDGAHPDHGGAELEPGDGEGGDGEVGDGAGDGAGARSGDAVPAGVTEPGSTATASTPGATPESAEEAASDD